MNKEFFQYIRHLSKEDRKTLSQKVLKIFEEGGELAKVALSFDSAYATNHRFVKREMVLEEAVDTVLTAISVAYHLDFTDEEIEEMMLQKAEKWAKLQLNEKDLKYPIPFEIHVTLKSSKDRPLSYFQAACNAAEVKPIVIDLQKNGENIQVDEMTSSKHFGTNGSAYCAMERIAKIMEEWGFEVLRKKIETVPWHPAAPRTSKDIMPTNCYFEAHIPVILYPEDRKVLTELTTKHNMQVHISSNAFKKSVDGKETIMVTYRSHTDTISMFERWVDKIYHDLSKAYPLLEVGHPIKEFSVYDTKVSHDASWLTAN